MFGVLTTTQAHSTKSFILSLCMKTIRAAKQAKVRFAYNFVQGDQQGKISKHSTQRKVLFWFDVFVAVVVVAASNFLTEQKTPP